jgi:ATP synthase protein I
MVSAQQRNIRWVWQFCFLQCLVSAFFILICALFFDQRSSFGALQGVAVYVIAQLVFIRLAFRFSGARQARAILDSFYLGEFIKILIVFLLGWLVVAMFSPQMISFILGLVVMQSAYFWIPLVLI